MKIVLIQMCKQDRPVLLMGFSGFRYNEIAEVLQGKVSSIGKILVQAKKKIRKIYKQTEEV